MFISTPSLQISNQWQVSLTNPLLHSGTHAEEVHNTSNSETYKPGVIVEPPESRHDEPAERDQNACGECNQRPGIDTVAVLIKAAPAIEARHFEPGPPQ